jgi:hypothetical protein
LIGKPEGKRPHGRPRRRWKDNIRMDVRREEIDWEVVDWIHLPQDSDHGLNYHRRENLISDT